VAQNPQVGIPEILLNPRVLFGNSFCQYGFSVTLTRSVYIFVISHQSSCSYEASSNGGCHIPTPGCLLAALLTANLRSSAFLNTTIHDTCCICPSALLRVTCSSRCSWIRCCAHVRNSEGHREQCGTRQTTALGTIQNANGTTCGRRTTGGLTVKVSTNVSFMTCKYDEASWGGPFHCPPSPFSHTG
jgi:hypothetical protein